MPNFFSKRMVDQGGQKLSRKRGHFDEWRNVERSPATQSHNGTDYYKKTALYGLVLWDDATGWCHLIFVSEKVVPFVWYPIRVLT